MEYKRLNVLDKRAKNHGANPYVDDYVGFTWNNIHSSAHNCFIENTGHLEFVGAPDFSNNFVSPAFQTRTYYTGMQNGSKKFQLSLVFYQLSLAELNAAFHWLDRTIVSDLYFDYEPYWKYSCKLSAIGTIEKYVTGRSMYRGRPVDLYLCRVNVTFETVYHPEAISTYTVYKYSDDAESLPFAYSNYSGSQYLPYTEQNETEGEMPSPFMVQGSANDHQYFALQNEEVISTLIIANGNDQNTTYTSQDYSQSDPAILHTINRSPFQLMANIIHPVDGSDPNVGYWRLTLKNPSAYPTPFKLHFYDVFGGIEIYKVDNQDWMFKSTNENNEDDIDANVNSYLIGAVDLKLDDDCVVDLHYNSEDGTVICANQLIEQIRGATSSIPCQYKNATANIFVPGAIDADNPAELILEIKIRGKTGIEPQIAVEYDTYEYMM